MSRSFVSRPCFARCESRRGESSISWGVAPRASTIRWTLVNDPWSRAQPTLHSEDQSEAVLSAAIHTDVTFLYANGDDTGRNPQQKSVQLRAKMDVMTADEVVVVWQR